MKSDPVFQKALENFKKDLTAQQCREFGITTLQDVKNEVNKIQGQHGSAKKLRGMSRMSKFLEAMQQLEQVISVFLNVSEVVAFIWGPIKFFLVVASSRLEMLECLLDTFTDISEAMPDLQGYVSIFKYQPEVLEVLERCYGDIIQFFHEAFAVLGRPGAFGIREWRRIFDSVWKTFRTRFSPILGSLRRHRDLLGQVKLTATFGAVETTRRALQESIEKSNEELKQIFNAIQQKRNQILDKLGSQGPHDDKGHRRLPDQRHPTSGDWILDEHLFLQWLDPNNISNDLLYLNGMPGAGKTTLVSRIVDDMNKKSTAQHRPLLNFYFEHGQSGKNLMMDMLRSIIEQLLLQDDAIVDDLHEAVLPAQPSDLCSVPWLQDVATRIILAQKRCYIVVDGLDECTLDQRKRVLQWLKTILSESKASNVVVKVLVSGQRDGVIDAMLHDCACTIRLDDQTAHLRDIENFSSSVLDQIKDRFPDLEDEEEIMEKLRPSRIMEASKGMFMYAKVVLDNFLSQTSIYELEQELEREYPHGLDEAYERVAERVLEKTSDARKRAALEILGLIACAARPLKWREIQCYFCINVTNGSCDPRRRKAGGPKDLCSSFVESEACASFPNMPSEAQLMMVHSTAKSYLLRSGRVDMAYQHMRMSLFCFHYLTRPAFDIVSRVGQISGTSALTGFYGFFDYAAAHWDHHLLQYVSQASFQKHALLTEEWGKTLCTAWMDFVKRFSDTPKSPSETSSDHEVPSDTSVRQSVSPSPADTDDESCDIQEIFKDWGSTRRSNEFERLAVSTRQIMQQTDLGTLKDRKKAVYLSLNGPFRPKCSRRACVHFNTGFQSDAELSRHIEWHEMAFKCPHTGCYACVVGFATDALLQAHLKRIHPTNNPEENLFPAKSRGRPRTLIEDRHPGDIESVQTMTVSISTEADMLAANTALHTAARDGQFALCIHLTQLGASPYMVKSYECHPGGPRVAVSAVQMSIRLGDYNVFSALRSAASEHHETAFIEEPWALLECILDALESRNTQFLMDLLACNDRRTMPFTLDNVLLRAGVETQRKQYGHRALSYVKRHVLLQKRNVQNGLQILISSELERHEKCGQPPERCYEQVLVAPDIEGRSLLHRLCESGIGYTFSEAVRFLLNRLRPEDSRRYDLKGNPPLFTAMRNKLQFTGPALKDQEEITQSFFQIDLHGARNTRNLAGLGPLEFACRHATGQIFPLVFELCGAHYSALHFDDILSSQADCGPKKTRMVFGLDCADERIHLAVEPDHGETYDFLRCLTDLDSEPDVLNMIHSVILRLPRETTGVGSVDTVPASNDVIQYYDNVEAAKVILSARRAGELLLRCHPKLEDLGRTQLRDLFVGLLRTRINQLDFSNLPSTQYRLGLENTEPDKNCAGLHDLDGCRYKDTKVISLLSRQGKYADLSSRETQDKLIQALEDSLVTVKVAGTQFPDGLREHVENLILYADAIEDSHFAASLDYIAQYFQ